MLAFVGGALHQSKIPASPEFAAASARQPVDPDEDGPLPADVHGALAGILEACDGDPFMTVGALTESGHSMPEDARGALAGTLALAGIPKARSTAVLFLLDPNSTVRRAVAGALAQVAASLTPTEVRRLIAMRNW
jgi:HEAT repeat protein